MRPRVFPAEDFGGRALTAASTLCFNEAAGIPRGRLLLDDDGAEKIVASMRPRVFPAEDEMQREIEAAEQTLQ